MDFTREQQLAVLFKGADLIVSAAAGSGKTAVLVERIIQMIITHDKPVDIDRLLIVTFTEQAAYEMKNRIETRLNEIMAERPGDENIKRQLSLIDKSFIMTIHAFCMSVIKTYFYKADIDPNFRIADEDELSIIKNEILNDMLEDEYKSPDGEFLALVETYGGKYADLPLRGLIADIHAFISAAPWPRDELDKYAEMYDIGPGQTIDDTAWAPVIRDYIVTELTGLIVETERALGMCGLEYGPFAYIPALEEDINSLTLLTVAERLSDLYKMMGKDLFSRLPNAKKTDGVDEHIRENVRMIRENVKKTYNALRERFFFKAPHLLIDDIRKLRGPMEKLADIVGRFDDEFIKAKKDRCLLDFNNLEHYCLAILTDPDDKRKPSGAAMELTAFFEEILIDEYQDSNPVQELILSRVAKQNEGNRFMVGDIKQSIYKFRRARPEIFIDKYNGASYVHKRTDGKNGYKIDLNTNFRSRETIISVINGLFSQIMSETVGDVIYDGHAALNYGADYPDHSHIIDDRVEITVAEHKSTDEPDDLNETAEIDGAAIEAAMIADRILELTSPDSKFVVYDKNAGYRSVKYGDIAILAPSVKNIGDTFTSRFYQCGIPLSVIVPGDFFESTEIVTIIAFLQVIDNPKQDVPLLTVLRTPAYDLSPDDVMCIKHKYNGRTIYDCAVSCANDTVGAPFADALNKFLSDVKRWRAFVKTGSIPELLWMIYGETFYYSFIGMAPDGKRRQNRLKTLVKRAVAYQETSYTGLPFFLKYIEKLKRAGAEAADPARFVSDDSVRMMTVHLSKGLEFPVVFLCRTGKRFNTEDIRNKMAMHPDYGLGPYYVDVADKTKNNTIARMAINCAVVYESLSEEMRLLYVAMTRAKEKLIITGTVNGLAKNVAYWRRYADYPFNGLPVHYAAKAKCFLDWIIPAAERNKTSELFKIDYYQYNEVLENFVNMDHERRNILKTGYPAILDAEYDQIRRDIREKLSWRYKYRRELIIPRKLTISEIKRIFYLEDIKHSAVPESYEPLPEYAYPGFMRSVFGVTGADIGRAIHVMMERLDLFMPVDVDILKNAAREYVSMGLIPAEVLELIPYRRIMDFTYTPLAGRIRQSARVEREVPFILPFSADEVYGDLPFAYMESILSQGIIDLYFKEDDGYVLVDYKSDAARGDLDAIRKKYAYQMKMYKRAIEEMTGEKVKEVLLYLFDIGDCIAV